MSLLDHTFQHASRIRFVSLGQNLRHLSEHSLDHLNYLTRFDVSKVVLDHLYPSSRCVLARFIKKQQESNPTVIILPPQAEYCDCTYDFILTILNQKPEQLYTDLCSDNQQERCQLNECSVVKNFRIPEKVEQLQPIIIDEFETTQPSPSYVHRHSSDQQDIQLPSDDDNIQVRKLFN